MVDWENFYASFRRPGFLPGYEIQNHLGGGAFGEVYKARKSSIGKPYAVKFLRLDGATNRQAADRELEQVRLFASIDHPHLVTIEDMGVVEGVPYLIMGYAGEETLARRIQRGDLDRESALRFFVQTARGVLALHDRRLAHFDLKPSNVFLKGDVARVGDYGLAKLLAEGRQTLSFGRGTPQYMAPEMVKSRADHRADIYSLGVILFESMALRLPFGEPQAAGLVREDDHAPDFPPDFPAALRGPVERCLRLDPEDRYASVHELLEALGQNARQGDSVQLPELDGERRSPFVSPLLAAERAAAGEQAAASKRELRRAAAEVARGAVGVARGVWDGIRPRATATDAELQEPLRRDPGLAGNAHPPGEPGAPGEPRENGPPGGRSNPPFGSEVFAVSGLGEGLDAQQAIDLEGGSEEGGSETGAGAQQSTPRAVRTIPVPPPVEGLFGTLGASINLGLEILGTLVSGPALAVVRRLARAAEGSLQGVLGRGVLGSLLRLALLLLGLAFFGGLVSFVILALVSLKL